MSINPERAKARVAETEKEIKKIQDLVSKAKSEWEVSELVVKAAEEAKNKLAVEVSAKCKELEDKILEINHNVVSTPGDMENQKTEVGKVMEEINAQKRGLESEEQKMAAAMDKRANIFKLFTEVQKSSEHALFQLQVRLEDQKKALERKVREYPMNLARHLRHCSNNGCKDQKTRTNKTVLEARKDAAASTITV